MRTPTRLIASAVLLLALAVPLDARASTAPTLTPASSLMDRGTSTAVFGRGMLPDTTYSLSADFGYFGTAALHETEATTDSTGFLRSSYTLTSDVPYSATSVSIHATAPDHTIVDGAVTVGDPGLIPQALGVCPGQTYSSYGVGFADGTYSVTAPGATFRPATVQASDGHISPQATLPIGLGTSLTVTVTSVGTTPATTFSYVWNRADTRLSDRGQDYWRHTFSADCLAPGEAVTFRSGDARTIAPPTLHANAAGQVTFTEQFTASTTVSTLPGVSYTGAVSHQSGATDPATLRATTLVAGRSMTDATDNLISAHPGWEVRVQDCYVMLSRYIPTGSNLAWSVPQTSPGTGCHLVLRSDDGNLALYNRAGHGIWSAGTAGIGPRARLVMRDDGALAVYTSAGHVAWTSSNGLIRTPSAMGLGQSLLRGESLVNGTTRLILRSDGNLVVYRSGVARWSSGTAGRGAVRLLVGQQGELVLLTSAGHIVWANHVYGEEPCRLDVLATGDVRVTDAHGHLVWRTGTG